MVVLTTPLSAPIGFTLLLPLLIRWNLSVPRLLVLNLRLPEMSKLDFSACVPASDASALDEKFLKALEALAENFGALKISSGFRSKEYELCKGRKGTSSHCKGLAVDILVKDGSERHRLLYMALMMGFPRIGIGKTFIHLDFDTSKPYPTCWTYYE